MFGTVATEGVVAAIDVATVARVNPPLAYALARENDASLRPMTLAAVVSATADSVNPK